MNGRRTQPRYKKTKSTARGVNFVKSHRYCKNRSYEYISRVTRCHISRERKKKHRFISANLEVELVEPAVVEERPVDGCDYYRRVGADNEKAPLKLSQEIENLATRKENGRGWLLF